MGFAHAMYSPGCLALPGWLPGPVRVYLVHTEGGKSIRSLARAAGCHPSTTLRQVQRTETLRDDPLADAGLTRLGRLWRGQAGLTPVMPTAQDLSVMMLHSLEDAKVVRETLRVLRALMEPDCLLVIADGVEDAVVVRNAGGDRPVRRAVLTREIAESLALREFISGRTTGRITRYTITPAGRIEVSRLLAELESARAAAQGVPEDANVTDAQDLFAQRRKSGKQHLRRRTAGAEAPLQVLARRRRADGEAWLPPELVAAALRFRESFEIARLDGRITRDWESLVAGRITGTGPAAPSGYPTRRLEAEQSLEAAIRALGPDLAETIILGVCHDEGMEELEARLDFPARSGKIVLRIALRTLARHYAEAGSEAYDLIY